MTFRFGAFSMFVFCRREVGQKIRNKRPTHGFLLSSHHSSASIVFIILVTTTKLFPCLETTMQASFSASSLFAKNATDLLPPSLPQRQVSREYKSCSCLYVSSQTTPRTPSRSIASWNEKQNTAAPFLFPKYAAMLHTSDDSASVLTDASTSHGTFEHTIFGRTSQESLMDDDDDDDEEEDDDDMCLSRHFYRLDNQDERSTDHCDDTMSHRWVHSSGISPSSSSEWTMPLQPQRKSSLSGGSKRIL